MAGEEAAGVLYTGGAFVGGFEEVAHLSGEVAEGGHGEKMGQRDFDPEAESIGDEERAEDAARGAFPGFLGGDVRSERMNAKGAADEVGDGVSSPGDGEGEEEEAVAKIVDSMQANGVGEWECHKKKSAGADSGRGKRFN